jgi:hypothetical protein
MIRRTTDWRTAMKPNRVELNCSPTTRRGRLALLAVAALAAAALVLSSLPARHQPLAESNDHGVTPTAEPAALAPSARADTAAGDLVSYCGSSQSGQVEVDYELLDMQGVDATPVVLDPAQGQGGADYDVVSVTTTWPR